MKRLSCLLNLIIKHLRSQMVALGCNDKSNEISAIPALLKLLDITGSIITLDAMGTQTEIADLIIRKGGDYVLSLKANHPTLLNSVRECFNQRILL